MQISVLDLIISTVSKLISIIFTRIIVIISKSMKKNKINKKLRPTCTMLLMTMGSMFRGKRRMLKRARDTKALRASRMFFSFTSTYTANDDSAT